jgi:hypothetical protein
LGFFNFVPPHAELDTKNLKISKMNKIPNKKPSKFTRKWKIPLFPLVKLHTKQLKTPKMTRRKLQTLELQNCAKVKTFKIHKKKSKCPLSPLVKLHTKKLKTPKMTKINLTFSRTSTYQNKKTSKFTKRKANTPFPLL